jgi:hypothetical protein
MNSAAYQRSSKPDETNRQDERYYSRYIIRRLPAETMLDAISQVTGVPTDFPGYPAGVRAMQLPDSRVNFYFLAAYGEIKVKPIELPAGQTSTVIMIGAATDASGYFPLRIQGVAAIDGKPITRDLKTDDRISIVSVAPPPELIVWTEPQQIILEPGGDVWVTIKIKRERGFAGRIPFDIRNLPHGVIVKDVGLNGVMIAEGEETQRFQLAAESWVKPMEQPIFVVGRIETTSPQRLDFPAKPFRLVVRQKNSKESAMKSDQK